MTGLLATSRTREEQAPVGSATLEQLLRAAWQLLGPLECGTTQQELWSL